MVPLYTDDDADLRVVQGRHVAVLGYGDQGRAQALSLRDSGVDVRVGLPVDSSRRPSAEAEGLRVVSPYEACEEADLVVVLVPEQAQRGVYAEAIEPNLVDGDGMIFGHGLNVHYDLIEPPAEVDVLLVAPTAAGPMVRREYVEGRGVPVLVAVDQDATGEAWQLVLSYAKAIGGLRAGGIETTFGEQTETDLFGSQAVSGGGVTQLVLAGFHTLTSAGYSPEVAYLECVQGLKEVADLMYQRGIAEQREAVSALAQFTGQTGGGGPEDPRVERQLAKILANIRDGTLARAFVADQDAGAPELAASRARAEHHPIEDAGREVRALMPWVRPDPNEDP